MDYDIRAAESDEELRRILSLQAANLRAKLDPVTRRSQGFVTLCHDLELLRSMCGRWQHVVAASLAGDVVAYALVMLVEFRSRLPDLDAMFERLQRLSFKGRPIPDLRFYIMGQICVAREHRGRGLVEQLYAEHRRRMSPHFDLMVTEIDHENPRSLRAHEKAGFQVVDEYRGDDGRQWLVVVMDLRPTAG